MCVQLCAYVFIYIYTPLALCGREYPVAKGPFAATPGDPPGLQSHASTDLLSGALFVENSPIRPGFLHSGSNGLGTCNNCL